MKIGSVFDNNIRISMKIQFRIEGIAALYKLMNKKKKLDFSFQGNTLTDLVNGLTSKFGPSVETILLDNKSLL